MYGSGHSTKYILHGNLATCIFALLVNVFFILWSSERVGEVRNAAKRAHL